MSLRISNLATAKQKAMLLKLGYNGTGQYTLNKLTVEQAGELLDELFEEQRLNNDAGLDDDMYP